MAKIKLDVDELQVESFPTAEEDVRRGTVIAHQTGVADCDWSFSNPDNPTCSNTVWQAGCSFETAPLDCAPTVGPYIWCSEI